MPLPTRSLAAGETARLREPGILSLHLIRNSQAEWPASPYSRYLSAIRWPGMIPRLSLFIGCCLVASVLHL
jgi:hypothetical protein